jgi:hypothetical protein
MPDMPAKDKEFTCDVCGETFIADWTEDEAMAEAEINFPGILKEKMGIACDDCFEKVMAVLNIGGSNSVH